MKNENIKMRVNRNEESVCEFCNDKWMNVQEMYDMMLIERKYTICKRCMSELFMRILKADCMYNGKIKSKEDLARADRYHKKYGFAEGHTMK
jgi:hypothetical protein